jgi:predicted TIM-barrel fold metal-dependent hydrolase
MNNIPIFDTLTHPTIDTNWILPKYPQCARINDLLSQMEANNICAAFAVGMSGIGSYNEDLFLQMIQQQGDNKLYPIAFFTFVNKSCESLKFELQSIKSKGYIGIKLHPRIGDFKINDPLLPYVIDCANELGLVVLFCTYFYSNKQGNYINNVDSLGEMLTKVSPTSKVILLHGGAVRLLETMEIVRAFPNTILDLSLTMCKYKGSSLDMDITFLFREFDRRICIGTDHPEISHKQLRERFNYFASFTTQEKAENIAYKNIIEFIGTK